MFSWFIQSFSNGALQQSNMAVSSKPITYTCIQKLVNESKLYCYRAKLIRRGMLHLPNGTTTLRSVKVIYEFTSEYTAPTQSNHQRSCGVDCSPLLILLHLILTPTWWCWEEYSIEWWLHQHNEFWWQRLRGCTGSSETLKIGLLHSCLWFLFWGVFGWLSLAVLSIDHFCTWWHPVSLLGINIMYLTLFYRI